MSRAHCPPPAPDPTQIFLLTSEIVQTLAGSKACGITVATLLNRLFMRFPDSLWTEDLLNMILADSFRKGLVVNGCGGRFGGPARIALNPSAAIVHPDNQQYVQFAPKFMKPKPSGQSTQRSVAQGVFSGNEPCCW